MELNRYANHPPQADPEHLPPGTVSPDSALNSRANPATPRAMPPSPMSSSHRSTPTTGSTRRLWRAHREACRIARMRPDQEDTLGHLVHRPGEAVGIPLRRQRAGRSRGSPRGRTFRAGRICFDQGGRQDAHLPCRRGVASVDGMSFRGGSERANLDVNCTSENLGMRFHDGIPVRTAPGMRFKARASHRKCRDRPDRS